MFMKPQTDFGYYVSFEDEDGGYFSVPQEYETDCGARPEDREWCETHEYEEHDPAWWARYSAPGYMDCTPWMGPYSTKAEALADLEATYGDDA